MKRNKIRFADGSQIAKKRVSFGIDADLAKQMREAASQEAIPLPLADFTRKLVMWAWQHYPHGIFFVASTPGTGFSAEVDAAGIKEPEGRQETRSAGQGWCLMAVSELNLSLQRRFLGGRLPLPGVCMPFSTSSTVVSNASEMRRSVARRGHRFPCSIRPMPFRLRPAWAANFSWLTRLAIRNCLIRLARNESSGCIREILLVGYRTVYQQTVWQTGCGRLWYNVPGGKMLYQYSPPPGPIDIPPRWSRCSHFVWRTFCCYHSRFSRCRRSGRGG